MLVKGALLILLFVTLAHPLFLVGEGNAGETISILCENHSSAFVSAPGGGAKQLALDSSFQAEFSPDAAGPYAVQCGNETKVVDVKPQAGETPAPMVSGENGSLYLAASVIFVLFFASGIFFLLRQFVLRQTVFTKTVEEGKARLFFRSGKTMKNVRITDPVAFDFSGKTLEFSLPLLAAGKEWSWEYDIEMAQKALPASLEAECNGEKMSLLSQLYIEGKPAVGAEGKAKEAPSVKRKLPKAK